MSAMKLIVGLGNPGTEYDGTRHNIGFRVLDSVAETPFKNESKFKAEISEMRVGSEKVILAKPTTFMNLSGDALQALKSFYKLENSDILIVHDEMAFPVGRFAFTVGASPAGHNGVASIQERLGSKDIPRLRIGIGRPTIGTKEDFVLTRFTPEEHAIIDTLLSDFRLSTFDWVSLGIDKSMNIWNVVESGPPA